MGEVLREMALRKERSLMEGHLMGDHVHMLISIPPKYAASQAAGYIKGKSAMHSAGTYGDHKKDPAGQYFWIREYYVSLPWPEMKRL